MSEEASAMHVEPDDFILSFEGDSDGQTEITTTEEVSDLPADLVNTDVSELANNPSLWLGLEGALETHVNSEANVSAMVEEHVQMNETLVQMGAPHSLTVETLGHSEEVETMSMEVDVQTSEVGHVEEEINSMDNMESFMDHTDLGLDMMTKEEVVTAPSAQPMIPVTLSLPVPIKTVLQPKKTVTTTSQVTKVVLAPAGHQNASGQPFLFTVPSSVSGNSGLSSILAPNTSIRFVNAGGKLVSSSSASATTQSVRLMSPTKTITLQQAQQLGLISPKKGQSLIVSKMAVTSSASVAPPSQGSILAGKTGAKFAGGNVTLVRSAPISAKTPTKIAPAPSVSTASTAQQQQQQQQQPTSLLIKNAAGQVTMATLVQARPNSTGNPGNLSPQKFVLRPAAPGSVTTTQIRQGNSTQPAQYIRLTTAQALAAGILPASHSAHGESGVGQQIQFGGNKIQLVRVVNPGGVTSGSPKVVINSSSAGTVKMVQQQQPGKVGTVTKTGQIQVKTTTVGGATTITTPGGTQRILLPAGSTLPSNIMMMPAQYVTLSSTPTLNSSSTTVPNNTSSAGSSVTTMSVTETTPTPVSTPVAAATPSSSRQPRPAPVPSPESASPATSSATPGSQSKSSLNVLESNGLKQRKPCNCTKSQCLKLYCDCFANGEFCHGCNCVCCANNLEHEELRLRAIRSCLDRNPHAFKPKIGVGWGPEPRRHNKGCHCKRSGCLKNYCECYEAKIACTDMCKCVGCKNCVDPIASPPGGPSEKKGSKMTALLSQQPSSYSEGRSSTNPAAYSSKHLEERPTLDPTKGFAPSSSAPGVRPPFSFITQEVVEATCQCLLAQAEEAERLCKTPVETEGLVLEEFGRCLLQIIEYASKAKVSASP